MVNPYWCGISSQSYHRDFGSWKRRTHLCTLIRETVQRILRKRKDFSNTGKREVAVTVPLADRMSHVMFSLILRVKQQVEGNTLLWCVQYCRNKKINFWNLKSYYAHTTFSCFLPVRHLLAFSGRSSSEARVYITTPEQFGSCPTRSSTWIAEIGPDDRRPEYEPTSGVRHRGLHGK